jgi:hypothetical protein
MYAVWRLQPPLHSAGSDVGMHGMGFVQDGFVEDRSVQVLYLIQSFASCVGLSGSVVDIELTIQPWAEEMTWCTAAPPGYMVCCIGLIVV